MTPKAVASSTKDLSLRAQPQALACGQPLTESAQNVMREMFNQFTANLEQLQRTDQPEVVHQARVGWRRWRSACRLFAPVFAGAGPPPWAALKSLLTALGQLRDLDVARTQTLPPLAPVYLAGGAGDAKAWQAMMRALFLVARAQRSAVRRAMKQATVSAALAATQAWLQTPVPGRAFTAKDLRRWARRRIRRLDKQLQAALKAGESGASQHRVRIVAKRLRYGVEVLHPLLPRRRACAWQATACRLQQDIGATRDLAQALALVARLNQHVPQPPGAAQGSPRGRRVSPVHVDADLVQFLRGFAAGSFAAAKDLRFE